MNLISKAGYVLPHIKIVQPAFGIYQDSSLPKGKYLEEWRRWENETTRVAKEAFCILIGSSHQKNWCWKVIKKPKQNKILVLHVFKQHSQTKSGTAPSYELNFADSAYGSSQLKSVCSHTVKQSMRSSPETNLTW